LLAAFHGYSYCPPPDCGPVCGLCSKDCCTAGHVGYEMHGDSGCATCGGHGHGHGHAHGANLFYKGPLDPHEAVDPHIMHENWNIPRTTPVPGKPIHKAQQPGQGQMTRAKGAPTARPASYQLGRTSPPIGSGVRTANYQR
jgi:hypothetical protein